MNTSIGNAADTFRHYIELLFAKTQGCELSAESRAELAEAVAAFKEFERKTDASLRSAFEAVGP